MAEKSANSSRSWILGVGAIVAVVLVIFLVRSFFRDKVEVKTAQTTHAALVSTVSTNGKVEPVEDYQAHSSAPGVVQKVYVDVGQHVQAGAELIRMDDSDARSRVATAQATLLAAETNLQNMRGGGTADERLGQQADLAGAQSQQKQAAASLAATQALQARGSASANEVSVAQQKLADAQAKVSQIEARKGGRYSTGDFSTQQSQVAQARAAVDAAKAAYAGVDFRAPFAGTVYSVPVADYDFVQAGEALLNLADLNRIRVRAYFDEPDVGKLSAGQPVKIVWDAKAASTWHGHIERAPTTIITYGTRNVGECIITVDDARGDLLPNTNVTVTVTYSQLENVLSLPREALRTEGTSNYVFRIVNGRLQRTVVQVGAINVSRVQITGGLSESDVVAISGPANTELKDGLEVQARP